MDEAAFGAVERAIRGSMTAEQCVRIERLARETVASRALEALIGRKVVDLAESRRCPHCGTVGIVKHGRDKKIVVFKYKRRKGYARKQGHRQGFTEIRIDSVQLA